MRTVAARIPSGSSAAIAGIAAGAADLIGEDRLVGGDRQQRDPALGLRQERAVSVKLPAGRLVDG